MMLDHYGYQTFHHLPHSKLYFLPFGLNMGRPSVLNLFLGVLKNLAGIYNQVEMVSVELKILNKVIIFSL